MFATHASVFARVQEFHGGVELLLCKCKRLTGYRAERWHHRKNKNVYLVGAQSGVTVQ